MMISLSCLLQISGEYLMVGVRDGALEYRVNLGDGPALVSSAPHRVNNDLMIRVTVLQSQQDIKLELEMDLYNIFHFPGATILFQDSLHINDGLLYLGQCFPRFVTVCYVKWK